MKKKYFFIISFFCFSTFFYAQVGIGTPLPDNSAQLDVVAGDKGVLIPRVALISSVDTSTITNGNIESLLVYNTQTIADIEPGYHYWDGARWVRLGSGSGTGDIITTLVDNGDGTYTYTSEDGTVTNIDVNVGETLTTLTDNGDGTITYVDEDGVSTVINIADIIDNFETVTNLVDNGDGTITYTNEDGTNQTVDIGAIVDANETLTTLTDNGDGTITYVDEDGVSTVINIAHIFDNFETVTNLVDNGDGTITYTNEDSTNQTINIAAIVTANETLTVYDIQVNDNGTPGDTSDDFQEITYQDEEGTIHMFNLSDLIDSEETLTVIDITTNDNGTPGDPSDDFQELTYLDEDGTLNSFDLNMLLASVVIANETLTTLPLVNGQATYTSEDGTETILNITQTGDGDPNGNGTVGVAGDVYVDENTGDVWTFDGNVWINQNAATIEPWFGINGTLLDLTDDSGATSNIEDIYQLGNVAVGTLPAPGLAFTVGTDPGEDVAFLRFEEDVLQEDVDLDFIRGYGTNTNPAPITDANLRLGGVRFRAVLNVDPVAVAASPLTAFAPSAEIAAETDGVPSLTSAPGRLVFQTTPVNSLNTQTRMIIDNQGDIQLNEYPSDRDDSVANAPTNILYTDIDGNVLSAPTSEIGGFDPTTDGWIDDPDNDMIKLSTLSNGNPRGDDNQFYIKDDGRVVIGSPLDAETLGSFFTIRRPFGTANLRLTATDGAAVNFLESYGDNETSVLRFSKGRGTELAQELVQDNDVLGQMDFWGWTGRTPSNEGLAFSAIYRVEVDGIPTLGANRVPTRFTWRTSNGSNFPAERMRLDKDGNLGLGETDPTDKLDVNGTVRVQNLPDVDADDVIVMADETTGQLRQISTVALVAEPWFTTAGTLLDQTDDTGATTNTEDVYQLGNVAVGTLPAPGLAFTVGTDPGEDVAFLRFEEDVLQEDVDLDFIRGYGTNTNPAPITDANLRLGGVRFRTVLNVDPVAVAASPLTAFAPSAEIAAETDGIPSLTSAPGRLVFQTTPVNSLNTQTRMIIDNQGNIGINEPNPDEKLVVNGTIKATDINFTGLPVFPDDVSAGAGGLVSGDCYRTATGELRIKL